MCFQEGIYTFAKSRWKHVTKSAKSIVAGMLNVDTEKRLTAVDVLNHPWLAKASDDVYSVVSNGSRRPSVDSRRSSIDSQDYNSSPHAKTPKSIWSPRKLSKVLPEIIEKNDTPCESMKLPGEIAVEEKLVQDEEVRIEEERPFSDNIDTNGDETDTFVMLRSTKMTKNSENTQSADNLRSSRFRENNGSSKKHKSLDFRDDTYVGDGYAVENESDDDDDACHEKIKKWVSEDDADMDTLGLTFGADKGSKPVHIPKIDLGYNNSVSPMSDFNGDNHSSSGVVSHWHKDFYDMNANESGYEWIKNMFTRDSMDANMHQMNTYKSTVTLIGSKDSKNSDDHEVFETVFYRSSKAVHPSCPTTVNSDTSMNDSYYSRMFTPRLGPNDRPVFEASD